MVDKNIFVDNVGDLARRIENTIILYDGKPVYIAQVADLNDIALCCVTEKLNNRAPKYKRVGIKDPLLDVNPFRLGYVNEGKECTFVTRRPGRITQIGLLVNKVKMEPYPVEMGNMSIVLSNGFINMCLDKYPHFTEAYNKITNFSSEEYGMAFHRLWALRRDPTGTILEFRGRPVGRKTGEGLFDLYQPKAFHPSMLAPAREWIRNAVS